MSTPSPGAPSRIEVWSRAADARRRIGRAVEFHAQIGSTNDRALSALSEPGGEGLAIVADLQTRGRGRRGRAWLSPPGANLMVSVGLRPRMTIADAWWIGAAAALATCQAGASASGAPLAIRWPNDIVSRDGLKVAGLLIETILEGDALAAAVIGIGINVNWPRSSMPADIAERATSLGELRGEPIDRVELLSRLLARLDAEVADGEAGRSPLPRYRSSQWLAGRQVTVRAADRVLEGEVTGIGEDGGLLLRTPDGSLHIGIGEVVHVADRSWIP